MNHSAFSRRAWLSLRNVYRWGAAALALGCACIAHAAPSYSSSAIYPATPPNITASEAKPMMMLVASKDHTLFSPIYTDFEDLDGDGVIDTTFKPTFKYYGYFDATKCYLYKNNTAAGRYIFEPSNLATLSTTTATASGSTVAGRYVCGGAGQWSGNFLNWASMTRLDVLRKILYGGQRAVDTGSETILHIARLSQDSHSFVKYYSGKDILDYTPFSEQYLTKTSGQNVGKNSGLSICIRANTDDTGQSSIATMRMARGNYKLWATVNGLVCEWGNTFNSKLARYYNDNGINHESEKPDQATYSGLGPDLNLQVKVCVSGLLGNERCQAYGSSTIVYKPVGLLQNFGTPLSGASAARTEFGLISGSYDNNLTAGALRKNITDLLDEIHPNTGQFCFSSNVSCPTTALADGRSYTKQGVINALDRILLYGRKDRRYDDSYVQLPTEMSNGILPAWGNPMGEMVVQAMHYYGALSSTKLISTKIDGRDGKEVGIQVAGWDDPLSTNNAVRTARYGKPICRPLNVLALSSSALSFDGDDASLSTLPNQSRGDLVAFTNAIGAAEGIHNTVRSIGTADVNTLKFGESCAAKTIKELGKVSGICPEAPGIGGSYKVAGAALYANTNQVREVASVPTDLPTWGLKVKTYAASLSGGVARIDVPIPNTSPKKYVYITPEGLWASNGNTKKMPAGMLTFNAISSSGTHGAFMVTWNDSLFGGDYDMDITGYLRYDIIEGTNGNPSKVTITTDIVNIGAGWTGVHGFSIIGSNGKDGRYLTHRHGSNDSIMRGAEGYLCAQGAYTNSTNLSNVSIASNGAFPGIAAQTMTGNGNWACNTSSDIFGIQDRDSKVSITFEMKGAGDATLREPLWYAAKYGTFTTQSKTATSNELPTSTSSWDSKRNDGKACGGDTNLSCQDGEPDGYFLARRPELLEQRLQETLESIIANSNSAPAVSSSRVRGDSLLYVTKFDNGTQTGSIEARPVLADGSFSNYSIWNAGNTLKNVSPTQRVIITNDAPNSAMVGVPFQRQTAFSAAYSNAVKGTGLGALTEAQRLSLINYLRGDTAQEKPVGLWRARSSSNLLGTVINSTPWIQGRPVATHIVASERDSYRAFVNTQEKRTRVLWTGANDGMLHAFDAQTGRPMLSYVPAALASQLKAIAQGSTPITPGVDGSPFSGDVRTGAGNWKTYLFGSLGRGGRAVFALDATNPSSFAETSAGSIFRWIFSADDDTDLGYTLGEAQLHSTSNQPVPIARMNNGKYAVLVPNGTGSTGGKGYLFILFVDGPNSSTSTWSPGVHYVKLATDALGSNGLMGVNWVDTNDDGTADVIYATDIQGRIWKFDVSNSNPANWKSAFTSSGNGVPLFEAKSDSNRLSISTQPTLAFPNGGGTMVLFGTGKAIQSTDFPDSSNTQRLYGIYDRTDWSGRNLPPSDLSTLAARNFVRLPSGDVYATASKASFDTQNQDGWYANFAPLGASGTTNNEVIISNPQLYNGILFFSTVRPADSSTNQCYANPLATSYALDPYSGIPKASVYGTIVVNGQTINVAGKGSSDQRNIVISQTTGNTSKFLIGGPTGFTPSPSFNPYSRRQWREIPNMRTNQ